VTDHETDVLEWSAQQAELLRRHARGERLNETPDWPNIIEEIEDVGGNGLRAVRSHLLQAMLHELKLRAWPESRDAPHWAAEARGHRGDAADDFAPSMRQHIDLPALYRRALQRVPSASDGIPRLPLPDACPWTLDDLLEP